MKYTIVVLEFLASIAFAGAAILENIWYIVLSVCCCASAIFNLLSLTKK